ncbi:hypothetical protein PENTCL1PPCAC_16435 [Pristionchus entomophagus]|uniref:Nuclear receptor domain-containing protein n=1 Tax=Pristionchus entomophagus TaxID=358040 RepID=A0AAV5TIX0_9BILA|nr:hypothetical protein PENTCL1PPCAC_16435 [Pristionchus entomophagus]
MDSALIPGKCLICSTPNTSMHLGIDACRACSNFFKRAFILGRRLPCRRGDRKCSVIRGQSSADGFMCRGCRYDRCAAMGMAYDGPMRQQKNSNVAFIIVSFLQNVVFCSMQMSHHLLLQEGSNHFSIGSEESRRRARRADVSWNWSL